MKKSLLLLLSAYSGITLHAQTVSTVYGTAGTAATSAPPSVVATSATLYNPASMLIDANNRMWVVEKLGNRVRLFDPNISPPQAIVRAGKPSSNPGSGNGTGVNASLNTPMSILRLPNGDFIVSDANNNCIRMISQFTNVGTIQTVSDFAGVKGIIGGFKDTLQRFAEFNMPAGMAMDSAGNIYIADAGNHAIRKIAPDSSVTTIGGDGTAGNNNGPLSSARFTNPVALLVLNNNTILVADQGNQVIRKIDLLTQTVSDFAGDGQNESDDGPLATASFLSPNGITMDSYGAIYVSEGGQGHCIRKIANGNVSTFAGLSGTSGSADGALATARFNSPSGLFYMNNALYVCDEENYTIRKITIQIPTYVNERSSFIYDVYPNPLTNELTVQITGEQSRYEIKDITGKLLLSGFLESGKNILNTSTINSGIYFVTVIQGETQSTQKIIKH